MCVYVCTEITSISSLRPVWKGDKRGRQERDREKTQRLQPAVKLSSYVDWSVCVREVVRERNCVWLPMVWIV